MNEESLLITSYIRKLASIYPQGMNSNKNSSSARQREGRERAVEKSRKVIMHSEIKYSKGRNFATGLKSLGD